MKQRIEDDLLFLEIEARKNKFTDPTVIDNCIHNIKRHIELLEQIDKTPYQEIMRLRRMIIKAELPNCEMTYLLDGFKFTLYNNESEVLCNVIEHQYSYGNKNDLLELNGGLTKEEKSLDHVIGNLSAEEVFKRLKYCSENNTRIYVSGE